MRRLLLGSLLATCAALLAFGYVELTRDGEYRDLIRAGDQAVVDGDAVAAIEAFSGAIALKPSSMLAWLRRGETYQLRGELGPALRDLRQAVDLDPSSTRANERLGDVLLAMGRYSRASEQYEAHLSIDDRAPGVLLKLGLARFHEGRCGPADAALRRALALDDRLAEAHYLMGLCDVESGDRMAAVAAFRRALELAPGLLQAREELASLYAGLERRTDELRQLETLATLEPDSPDRAVAIGLAQARHGRSEAALATFGRALDRFKDDPALLLAFGRLSLDLALQREDRAAVNQALETLSRAAARRPTGETLAELGRAQLRAEQSRQAFRTLQDAVEHLPVPNEAFAWLAEAAERTGEAAASRDALVRYLALEGERLGDRERLRETRSIVDLSLRVDDPATALRHFERHGAALGEDAGLSARLVAALWASGAEEQAQALLAASLTRHPADRRLRDLRARIP
jgi:tetratricopeptide (TPR) repeat protein